jgi:hypothetical protein
MKSNLTLIQFILRIQARSAREDGMGMVVVAVITAMIFVLMSTYLITTGIGTKTTQANADLTNTFYTAESGLNTRIRQLKAKFADGGKPTGTLAAATSNPAANIALCFTNSVTTPTTDDFECRSKEISSTSSKLVTGKGGAIGSGSIKDKYNNYTFVVDKTKYDPITSQPVMTSVPTGQNFGGMKVQEYVYTVYSTTTKQNLNTDQKPEAKTVLEMTVKNRVIPMFQFQSFYAGDMELGSSSDMVINGRVHTNGNLYVQPTPTVATDTIHLQDYVTAVGKIYNTIDSDQIGRWGLAQVFQLGDPNTYGTPNYQAFPTYKAPSMGEPPALTPAQVATFKGKVIDGAAGITALDVPDPGTMRKRNYYTDKISKYFGKADLRIEYVPDREIPINVVSVQQGSTNAQAKTCTTSLPATGVDPANNYIDILREQGTTAKCITFTKGQLASLMQPVVIRTDINQLAALRTIERTTLTAGTATPATPPTKTTTPGILAHQTEIRAALLVSIISRGTKTISYDRTTHIDLDCPCYNDNPPKVEQHNGHEFKKDFINEVNKIPGLSPTDKDELGKGRIDELPESITLLPPPIQIVTKYVDGDTDDEATPMNSGKAGFYDPRERRWINVLQINLQSLAVWNRDGFYVEAKDQDLTTAYVADPIAEAKALLDDTAADFSGSELVYKRAAIDSTAPSGSLASLGLGAVDRTEGGLIIYHNVSDDLDGNGAISKNTDIMPNKSLPLYRKNADGTNYIGKDGSKVILDYARQYKGVSGSEAKSAYGFAYTQSNDIPAPLTLASDQAMYMQGDFNNFGGTVPLTAAAKLTQISSYRRPASILADTITKLSDECVSWNSDIANNDTYYTNKLIVPASQIKCGIPSPGHSPDGKSFKFYDKDGKIIIQYKALTPTVMNAALMSNTDRSIGNAGAGRGYGSTAAVSSGGLENYVRLMEDWSNTFYTHTGSMVSLGVPLEYSGAYEPGDYTGYFAFANGRQLNYDPNFNTVTNLPPLTPTAVYLQQNVFKRRYD